MLKNEDLRKINNTIILLTTIKLYLLENDPTNFIDKTGVDLVDIQRNIKSLISIHTQETIKHIEASKKANMYNKAHPETHRRLTKESHKRHPEKRRAYQRAYYLRKKKGSE